MNNICIIDDSYDLNITKNYSELSIWGNPVIFYPINAAIESGLFDCIYVKTDSNYIKYIVNEKYGRLIETEISEEVEKKANKICYLSSRAVTITGTELKRVYRLWQHNKFAICVKKEQEFIYCKDKNKYITNMDKESLVNLLVLKSQESQMDVQEILIKEQYSLVINNDYDFELALILIKKRHNTQMLTQMITERIKEKYDVFKSRVKLGKRCCLIGHSQLDNWDVDVIFDYKIRNCGIGGISSFQYHDMILSKGILECEDDLYIVMHGTNDIIYEYSFDMIFESIMQTINYIKLRSNKPIIFLKCIHTNGRMDRENKRIDAFNAYIEKELPKDIFLMDVWELDDEYGRLRQQYTNDGLHLNDAGYEKLKLLLENFIIKNNLCD